MPYARISNRHRLYYDEVLPGLKTGSPEPVIFLHGFTLDRRMWQSQATFFGQRYRVLVPDARGHGLSDAPETGYSRVDRVEDLSQFVDRLGIDRFHLVGLSMGGSTALAYARNHQTRLASLTLVSTSVAGADLGLKIDRVDRMVRERGLEAARKVWMKHALIYYGEHQRSIRELVKTMMTEHSGAPWLDSMRGRYPSPGNDLEWVSQISIPTAVFVGSEDKLFVPLARELAERLPDSRLFEYECVGHMLNLELSDRFNHDLGAFLDEVIAP
ncbi:MAG: alpha/beta fold hydrolase [candidate division Zixibacteria bacterium]|nr:alpha/beta fold hydrolase [candidate division Zixibacteria bacterium]